MENVEIKIIERYDQVKVTKIITPVGILSWFIDKWNLLDIYITYNSPEPSLRFYSQTEEQSTLIINNFINS